MGEMTRRIGRMTGRVALVAGVVVVVAVSVGPRLGWFRPLTVLTGSMAPTLPRGSVVLVRPVPVEQVAVGDVLTYAVPVDDHRVVTHRVVEVVEPGVVRTRGDANDAADPWVARLRGSTAWTVRGHVPYVGYAIQGMRQPVLRLSSVLAGTLLMVGLGWRRIWGQPSLA